MYFSISQIHKSPRISRSKKIEEKPPAINQRILPEWIRRDLRIISHHA